MRSCVCAACRCSPTSTVRWNSPRPTCGRGIAVDVAGGSRPGSPSATMAAGSVSTPRAVPVSRRSDAVGLPSPTGFSGPFMDDRHRSRRRSGRDDRQHAQGHDDRPARAAGQAARRRGRPADRPPPARRPHRWRHAGGDFRDRPRRGGATPAHARRTGRRACADRSRRRAERAAVAHPGPAGRVAARETSRTRPRPLAG